MFNVYFFLFLIVCLTILFTNASNKHQHWSRTLIDELIDELKNEVENETPFDLAIKLKNGYDDDPVSELFAASYNLEMIARVQEFLDDDENSLFHFKLKNSDISKKRKKRYANEVEDMILKLQKDDRVEFVAPQRHLKRDKRYHGILSDVDSNEDDYDELLKRYMELTIKKKTANKPQLVDTDINKDLHFNDMDFDKEWYLINKGQLKTPSGHDLNIKDAWLQGYTGKGVVIVIIDDGLDHEHPDLKNKYKPEYSYDYNDENDLKHDPMPSSKDNQNNHGTKCAGAAAANANNTVCGVGVAYNAFIGGIRILDGPITDLLEARALLYKAKDIHIKSASWGPRDDGMHMEYPGIFVNHALEEGVQRGRNGLGTIFIWASGNGGGNDDDCSCDGYVSNWNVISIGSVNYNGLTPFFMERCPSTMAVVYSGGATKLNGDENDPGIRVVTSDVDGKCTTSFQGTSAAAPLAAGAIALLLEANPNVTYRDVMYLIARTSRIPNMEDIDGWIVNAAGYHVNEKYGFGVMDVGQLVQEAQKWQNVGDRFSCFIEYDEEYPIIPSEGITKMHINVKHCKNVEQLEHVVANITFKNSIRGDVKLTLISPSGTPSEILSYRKHDRSNKGAKYFPFMTLFNWGESPIGKWTLIIESKSRDINEPNTGRIEYFALKLFGTLKTPTKDDEQQQVNEKLVSRFFNKDSDIAFIPTYKELTNIYNVEKNLSRETRIINRNLLETNPQLRNV